MRHLLASLMFATACIAACTPTAIGMPEARMSAAPIDGRTVLDARGRARLLLEPCRLQGPIGDFDALCGRLPVPENPGDLAGPQIDLNIVVLPALTPREGAVPLFELAGGPGIAVTVAAGFYAGPGQGYRRHRPVVLVDRRGTGSSNPLRCPELEVGDALAPMYPLEHVRACHAELALRADLDRYGTDVAVGDLDRVREALGYDQIDLWGLSYGTILGQAYLRRFPHRVRSAVFMGVARLDFKTPLYHAASAQRALDLVFYECQMDAACRTAYPGLRSDWQIILQRLDEGPVWLSRDGTVSGEAQTVEIRRGPFAEAFRGLLGVTTMQRQIPLVIDRAAAGDFEPFLSRLPQGTSPFSLGLYLSVACSEGTLHIAPEDIHPLTAGTFLSDYRVNEERAACAEWPATIVTLDSSEVAAAEVPVLILSGEMDHVTPPRFAAELCAGLPLCRMITIPHLAHGPFDLDEWGNGDCLDQLAIDFFANPVPSVLDDSCVATMVPPPFTLPSARTTDPH
jgi:pimeloyl-ACP methyl ester carboxylesterase